MPPSAAATSPSHGSATTSCEVISLAPEVTRGVGPVGEPCPAADRRAGGHSGATSSPRAGRLRGATTHARAPDRRRKIQKKIKAPNGKARRVPPANLPMSIAFRPLSLLPLPSASPTHCSPLPAMSSCSGARTSPSLCSSCAQEWPAPRKASCRRSPGSWRTGDGDRAGVDSEATPSTSSATKPWPHTSAAHRVSRERAARPSP